MSLESDYLKAVIPHQARILGQRLRPFSVGHIMMLTRYQSPFITGNSPPQFGDLCFAIWVCKRDWKELIKGITNTSLKKEIRFLWWMSKFRNKRKAMLVFVEYITKAMNEPNLFFNKVDDSKPVSMNHLHYIKIVLMTKLKMTKEQVMDLPFGEAIFDLSAIGEAEGGCGFVTDQHEDALEAAKRNAIKRNKERTAQNGQRN